MPTPLGLIAAMTWCTYGRPRGLHPRTLGGLSNPNPGCVTVRHGRPHPCGNEAELLLQLRVLDGELVQLALASACFCGAASAAAFYFGGGGPGDGTAGLERLERPGRLAISVLSFAMAATCAATASGRLCGGLAPDRLVQAATLAGQRVDDAWRPRRVGETLVLRVLRAAAATFAAAARSPSAARRAGPGPPSARRQGGGPRGLLLERGVAASAAAMLAGPRRPASRTPAPRRRPARRGLGGLHDGGGGVDVGLPRRQLRARRVHLREERARVEPRDACLGGGELRASRSRRRPWPERRRRRRPWRRPASPARLIRRHLRRLRLLERDLAAVQLCGGSSRPPVVLRPRPLCAAAAPSAPVFASASAFAIASVSVFTCSALAA